jgi:hypothetical protein
VCGLVPPPPPQLVYYIELTWMALAVLVMTCALLQQFGILVCGFFLVYPCSSGAAAALAA